MMHATACIDIEDTLQNETSYMQKDKYEVVGVLLYSEMKSRIIESYLVEVEGECFAFSYYNKILRQKPLRGKEFVDPQFQAAVHLSGNIQASGM